jgi:hypothetical protein
MEESLQRALIRAQVIVDEAMWRKITNQPMLLQLVMLRDAMHRGYYMLDTFRYQPHDDEEAKDQAVSRSSSLSIVNFVKHLCFPSRDALTLKEMQDVNELVLFLTRYPSLYSQPYSMHLQLANCMFGRQMEAQLVINFLLHAQPHGAEELEVLPIVRTKICWQELPCRSCLQGRKSVCSFLKNIVLSHTGFSQMMS